MGLLDSQPGARAEASRGHMAPGARSANPSETSACSTTLWPMSKSMAAAASPWRPGPRPPR